jgi:cytochrome c oxidase cbb3-type subunit III
MSDDNKDYDGIKYRQADKPPLVFKILFTVLVVWGVAFMGHYLFGGWSSIAEYEGIKKAKEVRLATQNLKGSESTTVSTNKERKTANLAGAGKKDFAERCASCHGPDAKGGIGPDLTRKQFKYGRSAADVTQSVVEGRPGGMPSFKNDLSHEKIEGIVQYVLSL